MELGLVKWFEIDKGYGLLKSISTGEAFLHINNLDETPDKILIGTALVYESKNGRNGRLEAYKARPPKTYEDWKVILDNLEKVDDLQIEVDVIVKKRYGGTYRTKKLKTYSVKSFAAHQLLRKKSKEEIYSFVTRYFSEYIKQNDSQFYSYATFIEKKIKGLGIQEEKLLLEEIFSFFNKEKNAHMLFQAWSNNNSRILGFEDNTAPSLDDLFSFTPKEAYFPENELTINFFEQVLDHIDLKHIERIKKLTFGDQVLFLVFNRKFEQFKKLGNTDGYNALIKIYETISSEQLKQECEKKLNQIISFLDDVLDDKLLLQIGEKLADLETLTSIVKRWHHQSSTLTISLFKLLEKKGYSFEQVPNNFFDEFSINASQAELRQLIGIYESYSLVEKLIYSTDFKNYYEAQQLLNIKTLSAHSEALNDKFNRLFDTDLEQIELQQVRSISYIIKKLELKTIEGISEKVETLIKNKFQKELENTLSTSKLDSTYRLNELINKFNSYNDSLFANEAKQQLQKVFEQFIIEHGTAQVVADAWEQKVISDFYTYVKSHLQDFPLDTLEEILKSKSLNSDICDYILIRKSDSDVNLNWILKMSKQFGSQSLYEDISNKVFDKMPEEEYFELWKTGLGSVVPEAAIISMIKADSSEIYLIQNWLQKGLITGSHARTILFNVLDEIKLQDDRATFYTTLRSIRCLIDIDHTHKEQLLARNNPVYKLILWFLEVEKDFDLDLLKRKFILFSPDDQVKIFKHLFFLKHQQLIDFTLDDLDNILKADLDLYLTNAKFQNDFVLDISTSLLIEILKNFKNKGRFLADTELLKVVLHDIGKDRRRKFKIGKYFEKCAGRSEVKWDWDTKGKILRRQTNGVTSFIIQFDYNASLVDEVKQIPNRRYDNSSRNWVVPVESEEQVLAFGRRNKFFFDYGSNNYSNNPHLASFERGAVPNGVEFCDGRIANNKDSQLDRPFWWCTNQKCYSNCETEHLKEDSDYNSLTLLDILKILQIKVDENNAYGFFPNGKYYHLITQINRFNRLLERMYCRSCDEILFPVEASNFAAHTVVRFSCQNQNCSEHTSVIYLNHCLDGTCNAIIDSRDSKQCENGLYVCGSCGSCCSHTMLSRRLSNLRTTGGYIHGDLIEKVENKKGHLERSEYFCFKCAKAMAEVIDDVHHGDNFFKCLDCNVEYHPGKRIQRPHRHLRRNDYPTVRLSQLNGRNNFFDPPDDFPF